MVFIDNNKLMGWDSSTDSYDEKQQKMLESIQKH